MNIFDTVTIEEFKQYFFRDFSYLPCWCCCKTYMTGDVVFYEEYFYKSKIDNNDSEPTNTTNWERIPGNKYDYITDDDIAEYVYTKYCTPETIKASIKEAIIKLVAEKEK